MRNLYAVYFETLAGERVPECGVQRVYAESPRDAMIDAGAILAVHAPAECIVRVVA